MKTGTVVKKYRISRDSLRIYIEKGFLSPEKKELTMIGQKKIVKTSKILLL
ncbi:hypothetical protein [Streptococcus marimammalium]|uniref:hypothetical protein n=1 Tax=Streptococcus marimammalium TaxID=269666 RepID=UPI0003619157|nr:hypothetical protein [Streptococcus marimammalium]